MWWLLKEFDVDGVASAVINTVNDAIGVHLRHIPVMQTRVWRAIQQDG